LTRQHTLWQATAVCWDTSQVKNAGCQCGEYEALTIWRPHWKDVIALEGETRRGLAIKVIDPEVFIAELPW